LRGEREKTGDDSAFILNIYHHEHFPRTSNIIIIIIIIIQSSSLLSSYANPLLFSGKNQGHKWENAMTIHNDSWGVKRNSHLNDIHSIKRLIKELASTVR